MIPIFLLDLPDDGRCGSPWNKTGKFGKKSIEISGNGYYLSLLHRFITIFCNLFCATYVEFYFVIRGFRAV